MTGVIYSSAASLVGEPRFAILRCKFAVRGILILLFMILGFQGKAADPCYCLLGHIDYNQEYLYSCLSFSHIFFGNVKHPPTGYPRLAKVSQYILTYRKNDFHLTQRLPQGKPSFGGESLCIRSSILPLITNCWEYKGTTLCLRTIPRFCEGSIFSQLKALPRYIRPGADNVASMVSVEMVSRSLGMGQHPCRR